MATTTNFGWETPDDSDLVKDGAAAMRTLGNSIDASMADLRGGTTGQILSKNSNTDMDFTWIANDQGDITAVTAGTGISGGGTSGAVTITNSMATEITAKGDLIVGTGNATFDNLPVGTNGHTLVADSSTSTGLAWAAASSGAYTQIATGTLSGASVTISNIPGTYQNLRLVVTDFYASVATYMGLEFNGTANVYGRTTGDQGSSNVNNVELDTGLGGGVDDTNQANTLIVDFDNYAGSGNKVGRYIGIMRKYDNTSWGFGHYAWATRISSAISSIKMITASGGTWTAGTYTLYGVK